MWTLETPIEERRGLHNDMEEGDIDNKIDWDAAEEDSIDGFTVWCAASSNIQQTLVRADESPTESESSKMFLIEAFEDVDHCIGTIRSGNGALRPACGCISGVPSAP